MRKSVAEVVQRQVKTGIDMVDDGEHSKSSFASYARARIGGLERTDEAVRPSRRADTGCARLPRRLRGDEGDVRRAHRRVRQAARYGRLVCTGPIKYIGHAEAKADIDNLKAALGGTNGRGAFITAISPTNLEMYFPNRFYPSDEEYLAALADAMNEEYRTIVDAGFIVQIDDPRLITHYNRTPGMTIEECRKFIAQRVEAVNHSLKGIPEDKYASTPATASTWHRVWVISSFATTWT